MDDSRLAYRRRSRDRSQLGSRVTRIAQQPNVIWPQRIHDDQNDVLAIRIWVTDVNGACAVFFDAQLFRLDLVYSVSLHVVACFERKEGQTHRLALASRWS